MHWSYVFLALTHWYVTLESSVCLLISRRPGTVKAKCGSCIYAHIRVALGFLFFILEWRHNGCDGVSNHCRLGCLLKRLFMRRSKKTSKLRLYEGNSPVTDEFPSQRASSTKNVSIWWHHYDFSILRSEQVVIFCRWQFLNVYPLKKILLLG